MGESSKDAYTNEMELPLMNSLMDDTPGTAHKRGGKRGGRKEGMGKGGGRVNPQVSRVAGLVRIIVASAIS